MRPSCRSVIATLLFINKAISSGVLLLQELFSSPQVVSPFPLTVSIKPRTINITNISQGEHAGHLRRFFN